MAAVLQIGIEAAAAPVQPQVVTIPVRHLLTIRRALLAAGELPTWHPDLPGLSRATVGCDCAAILLDLHLQRAGVVA